MGSAYLRYSFTRGTNNETSFLVETLGLMPGDRVLDVGCGPGRHAHALGARGIEVVGIDISARFVELARVDAPFGVTFERVDARAMTYVAEFDAVISLCQGAFGLASGPGDAAEPWGPAEPDPDGGVLNGMARALRPGGRLAMSAFSAYFQVRFLEDADHFDADRGVNHERTILRNEAGVVAEHDLWTSCFTPRELRLLTARAGLDLEHLYAVTPGAYATNPPDLDHPEYLVIARRPQTG